ncbi:ATPase [Prevotella sp. HUN102]|uniref:ATPase n=1 Tax=Prevotella sp. HUN102 TaxID=1392486 RepID=UPI0004920C55|nr:ATPase [Prevotella sp. HUN102]
MILIADSGSTKTDWILSQDSEVSEGKDRFYQFKTQGINPFHQTEEQIQNILMNELMPELRFIFNSLDLPSDSSSMTETIEFLAFYGAGCNDATVSKMQKIFVRLLPKTKLEVAGDLLGAARALLEDEAGVATILGTGSNSCFYDGRTIVSNVPPLGYILGDEGSGASLGKLFMNGIFKGSLSKEIREEYLESQRLTYNDVIERVYRQPLANRFLASSAKFILQHIDEPGMKELVMLNFDNFFKYNISHYDGLGKRAISSVGSIAFYFKDYFVEVANANNYKVDKIFCSPIERMLDYHKKARR